MAWCMDQTRAWSLFFILASFTDSVSWGGCWQLHPVGSGLVMKRECLPSPNPCKIPLHLLLWLAIMPITHPRQWPGACSTPTGLSPSCQRCQRCRFDPWVRKNPWRRAWQPTPVFLPEGSHGQRSLAGYMSKGQRVRHDWSDLARTLCYALGPCCLRVLYIVVFICYSQTPTKFIPFGKHKSIFYVCKSICIL